MAEHNEYNADLQQKADGSYICRIIPRIDVKGVDDDVMLKESIAKFLAHDGIKSGDKLWRTINGEKVVVAVKE
jgi:hypothetical protein